MAPLPPVPNVVSVTFKFTYGQDADVITRFHVLYNPPKPLAADLAAYAAHQSAQASATWASEMSASVSLTQVTVVDMSAADGAVGISGTVVPGTRAGNPLPAHTCVLINGKVSTRYRGGKPRNYLPWGVASDLQDPQHWSSAALSSFTGGVTNLVTAMQTAQGAFTPTSSVAVSYYLGSTVTVTGAGTPYERAHTKATLRTGGPLLYFITLFPVNPRPGTQRRRLLFSS
jgi:hypothetical protein